jgi:hypothetical protein
METASNLDDEKMKSMARSKLYYAERGNLSSAEIEELVTYEYGGGPRTVQEQVRRYYLLLKVENPKAAKKLLKGANRIQLENIHTETDACDLCILLSRHINGFVIYPDYTQEARDEMTRKYQLPLKTMTAKAEKPYNVWHHGECMRAEWKAWRQGRPNILGYGMSEEEAVNDLRYRVQPDHDGTLDGLG